MKRANDVHTRVVLSDLIDEHSPKGFTTALVLAIKNDRLLRPVSWQGTGEALMYHGGQWYLWRTYDLIPCAGPTWHFRLSELWEVVTIDGELESELGTVPDAYTTH